MKYSLGILVLVAGATVLGAQSAGVPLRRKLTPGVDRYAVRCVMTTIPPAGMGAAPRTSRVTWDAAYRVGKAAGEKAPLTLQIENFEVKQPALQNKSMTMAAPPRSRTVHATLDRFNRLVPEDPKKGTNQLWLLADFISFPSTPVRVGSAWKIALPPGIIIGDTKPMITAKITGERKVAGKPAWIVTASGAQIAFEQKASISTNAGPPREARIHGKADVRLQTIIEKATGRTLELTCSVKKSQQMDLPGGISAPPTQIEYVASMKLKAGA